MSCCTFVPLQAGFGSGGAVPSNPYSPPEQWAIEAFDANLADVAMSTQVSQSFDTIKMIRAGSLVGLATVLSGAVAAGTVLVEVTINAVGTGLLITHTAGVNPNGGVVVQAEGVDTYAAGDLIGVRITTTATFEPVLTLNLEAWLQLAEAV